MSKYINKYANEAEAAAGAASRPADASSAAMAGMLSKYYGINVVTDTTNPEPGDAIYWDKVNSRRVLIKHGTLVKSLIDSNVLVDLKNTVVGMIYGKVVTVSDTQMAAKSWCVPDEWTLSGFDFSASGSATITVKYYSASGNDVKQIVLSWEAGGNIEALITQLNGTTGFKSYCKAYKVNASAMYITVSGYSASMGITKDAGDITVTRSYQGYQTRQYNDEYTTDIERADGTVTTSAFACFDKMYDYYYTNGAATQNATISDGAIKYAVFNTTDNPALVATYGTYMAYMQAKYELSKCAYPVNRYGLKKFGFGNDHLAAVSHTNPLGETVYDFQAHDAALDGVTVDGAVTGFEPGTGHMGGLAEAWLLYKQINRTKSDPINKAIAAKSGNAIAYDAYARLCFAGSAAYAWVFYGGSYGYLSYSNLRFNASSARVFRAFSKESF